jgi:DNA repair and recombination RAD54-like protein
LQLIYDTIKNSKSGGSCFDDCLHFFPPKLFSGPFTLLYTSILLNQLTNTIYFMQGSGSWTGGGGMWVELSGKMHVLARLLSAPEN